MRKFINGVIGDMIVYGGLVLVGFAAGALTIGKVIIEASGGLSQFKDWLEEHPELLQKASADLNAEPASEETDET